MSVSLPQKLLKLAVEAVLQCRGVVDAALGGHHSQVGVAFEDAGGDQLAHRALQLLAGLEAEVERSLDVLVELGQLLATPPAGQDVQRDRHGQLGRG